MIEFKPEKAVCGETLADLLREVEKRVVVGVIKAKGGHMTRAAEFLGVERSGLYKILYRHGLRVARGEKTGE